MRRTIATCVVTMSATFGMIGAAEAGPRPIGRCPTPEWELREIPPESIGTPSVDGNGDGLSCFMEAPEGGGVFTIVDNRVR
jgi:hypothetical protein